MPEQADTWGKAMTANEVRERENLEPYAWGKALISMQVIRADGTVEDRGVVSETEVERDPTRETGDA